MTLETLYFNPGIKVSVETKRACLSNGLVRRAVWWNGETQTVFEMPEDAGITNEEFVCEAVKRYAASLLKEIENE